MLHIETKLIYSKPRMYFKLSKTIKNIKKKEKKHTHTHTHFFFFEKCYIHNIFTTNYRWLVVIGSNLNLTLTLIFCPIITISNNLLFRICCKNVGKI